MKKLLALLLVFVMLIGMLPMSAMAADGISGSGTAEDPYVIKSAADLLAVADDLAGYYVLAADIAPETWTANLGNLTGTLDGNGHIITLPDGTSESLVNGRSTGTIKNLVLRAKNFTSSGGSVGIMASGNYSGKIYNCAVIGSVKLSATSGYAGGFASRLGSKTAVVENSYAAVSFTYTGAGTSNVKIGALVGASGTSTSNYGTFTNCFYDSTLCDTAIADNKGNQAANCTGKTTAEFKALASSLNANVPTGMLTWKDGANYPEFSSHSQVLSGDVALSGTAKLGQSLTVTDTFSSANTNAKTYAWYRVDNLGAEILIENAAAASYTLTADDVGYKIKVVAGQENTVGSRETDISECVCAEGTVNVTMTGAPSDVNVTLLVKNSAGFVVGRGSGVTIPSAGNYVWYATAPGYTAASGKISANGTDICVTVSMTKLSEGWKSEEVNGMLPAGKLEEMTSFPTSAEDANLKWATCAGLYGSGVGMNGEVTNPVYMDGSLYIIGGEGGKQQIQKIDPANGDIVKRTFTYGQGGYYYFLSGGGDMLYFRGNGFVEAFDKELNRVWLYEDGQIAQNYAGSILYSDGYIYFGTAGTKNNVCHFYCLSAADGSLVWKQAAELDTSVIGGNYWGFYWAGPVVIGDYVVVGSDGGRVYSFDRYTGEIVDRLDVGKDIYSGADAYKKSFIRTGVTYDGKDKIYFSSTDCYLHSASFDAATGKFSNHKYSLISAKAGSGGNATFSGDTATATPVIYNGRVYAASGTAFAVFNAETLERIYYTDTSTTCGFEFPHMNSTRKGFGAVRDLRLVAAENGDVYLFSSYYSYPGSVVMFKDSKNQTESSGWITLSGATGTEYAQFCASSPIYGPDGTIYATNDLGYLMAIERMEAKLTGMTPNVGTLDNEFVSNRKTYELVVPAKTESVTFTLEASEGATVEFNSAVVNGTASVELVNGKAEAVIVVKKGDYSITYKVSIRESSSNTDIGVLTSQSNNINDNTSVATKVSGVDNAYASLGCTGEDFDSERLWLGTVDANATMSAPSIEGFSATDLDGDDVYNNVAYTWRFFFGEAVTTPRLTSTTVTAEDGVTTKTYHAAMFASEANVVVANDANKDGSFDPTSEYIMAVEISKTSHEFTEANESITLTATAEYAGKAPESTGLVWSSSNSEVASVDASGKVTVHKAGSAVISALNADGVGASCTVTLAAVNTAPALKSGVAATATASVTVGSAYTLDLTTIFEDADGDALSYTVAIGDAAAVAASASYSYTPSEIGTTVLVFKANDGKADSVTYTVTLTAEAAPVVNNAPALKSGVAATVTASVTVGNAYTLDLTTIFEDADGDALSYTVAIDDAAAVAASASYSYTPAEAGTTVLVFKANDGKAYSVTYTVTLTAAAAPVVNTAPALKSGVAATATANVTVGSAYTLDLTTIFEDADGDALSYTVAIGDAAAVAASASYSYTPAEAGTTVLVFKANDGKAYSVTYTVTLTAEAGGSTGGGDIPSAPATINVYAYLSDDTGAFITGADGTLLWNVPITVTDENGDGKFTLHEAMIALHKQYNADGESAYAGSEGWINTLWGVDGGNFGFVINNNWCIGGATEIKANYKVAAYLYQDLGADYSDFYTWFDSTSYTAKTDTPKTFTVNGLNIFISGETGNAKGYPKGAAVTVYNAAGNAVMTSETDANGQFTLTFDKAGTYTIEVSGTCNYTASGPYGGGTYTDAPVVPSRCVVTVSGGSTGGSSSEDTGDDKNEDKKDEQTGEGKELSFEDVKSGDYFFEAVKWAVEKGITDGTSDTTFSPNASCTRAQMVTMLWRAAGKPAPKGNTADFKDVDSNAYYYEALLWAIENGITDGTGDTTFSPDAECTRGQMAAFLYRYAKAKATGTNSSFKDVNENDYFFNAVIWAAEKGITDGTSDTTFSPNANCTRGQMVTFLYRLLGGSEG